ncbi:hypothetical protein GW888_01435 [Candidatus Wolfebacteria bacterium]|uniref:Capsular polysaccharide assembling protein CapF C-terminal domain-containing protein n=2 Tax=Parcubacteria group TaxID=1794811 RepID=A0A2M8DNN5_9BACT|nr:hypothetical protein [Candidatus Wolfebacteria bacterium]PIZ44432.1 MAG: hypothetical protein COY31_02615 [Candidatus Wolfebacteria bacterium CG_4_10_14_0_2_um_filter_39_18]PJB99756.1 MAG: hypothetical protein CO077_00050 [Candidatus Nealsonbacteria bacterium CG_4_9_14_0_8_um_filter_35_12]
MSKKLEIKQDERGKLIEIFKIPDVGQVFYSTTKPGVVRGNHYHTRKKEYFCLIEGKGLIKLRNRETGEIKEIEVSGENPEIVEMPVNWTHNIKNIGDLEMKLLVWVNEVFKPDDPDTFSEKI